MITAAVPTYAFNADAAIGTQRPYATRAKLRVENLQLSTLPLDLQTPLEGQLRASADAVGTLDAPAQMEVTAVIDALSGAWNNQPFSLDGPARLRYANEQLAISQLRVVAQDSTMSVQGEMPLTERGAPGAITVDGRGNLATLAQYAPAGTNLTGSGDLLLTGTIRGTLRAVDPDLEVSVANGTLTTPEILPGISNLNLRARIADGETTIQQLTANWGEARLAANGRIPLEAVPELPVDIPRRGGPATFTAQVERLNLEEVPRLPQGLTGRVSLTAQISATRADLTTLEGQITFPELQLAFNGLTLNQEQESIIALARGSARVERFTLTGSAGTLSTIGTVGLTGDRLLDVDARGRVNVAAISVFTDAVRAEGDTTLNVSARGPMASPELNGFVDMQSASFVVDEPSIAAENVATRLELSGRRVSVSQLTGSLNGGALTGSGHVEFGADGIIDIAVEMAADDVAFDAPLHLRSLSDSKVALRKRGDVYMLEGQVTLAEAGLTGDINFDEGLLAAMKARRQLDLTEQRNAFLERVRFDLNIDTATPVIVDNNLARAEITADLRLIGTPYEPGLSGRLTIFEESEITLNERRYEVERGVITFIDERRILPSLDLRLNTSARNYDITIAITGTPGDTETSLTSDPTLPEPDIMAVLATGRTLDEMRGEEFEIAREQMLSYLAGRAGSQLGRGLERATGLDTVRLEPNLIANEADPNARLTVGEDIADDLELVYSVNLTDSNDQIWLADYDITRRFQMRGVRQSDSTFRFDVRHDLRYGGRPEPARVRRERPSVGGVSIVGDGNIPEAELRALLKLEEGDAFSFFVMRDRIEDVERLLEQRGHLQSRVRLQRDGDGRTVNVSLNVTAGPRVTLVFKGMTPPAKVVDEIQTKWRRGVFDTQRIDDSLEVLRAWLMRDNYLDPKLQGTIEELNSEERRVRFDIESGTRFTSVILAFEGANGIPADELDKIVNQQNLERALFTDPTQVTELLERYYREQGYLVASIDAPRYEFQATQARIVLDIDEGPRFVVREVTSRGHSVISPTTLVGELPVRAADPFLPFAAENALQHIRDVYWRRGYDKVHADYDLVLDRNAGHVDVSFNVIEGPQAVIADITVAGNEKTSDRLVREQVELEPGQPLDLSALARSRKNLYDTQSFSIVDITREELAAEELGDGSSAGPSQIGENPVRLNVAVREVQPFQLRYGLSYDTERGIGGLVDASNHNSLGKARVIGLTSRYDSQLLDLRGYISQPSMRYWPIQTTASIYYRDERNPETTLSTPFNVDRRGASIQQERKLANSYVWNWGFRYEKARTFNSQPGATLNELLTVTPITTSLTRETRDEVLDATQGSFSSHAFAYSPSWLGSDQAYIKYFGQYFHYIPLQRERRERFTNEILRPRFVYAAAVRLGIARSFGGGLPLSERFFAGGATTLRGFEQNAVGEIDPEGVPLGGSALFVINNELRFPLVSIFDGVVFSDIGNVFRTASEFSLTDLRETAGLGLRVRTRWFLIRGDWGVPLDRRAGERRGRFYFSLGQAF
jgi:outer membrane protein assembly complex protein YaeT